MRSDSVRSQTRAAVDGGKEGGERRWSGARRRDVGQGKSLGQASRGRTTSVQIKVNCRYSDRGQDA